MGIIYLSEWNHQFEWKLCILKLDNLGPLLQIAINFNHNKDNLPHSRQNVVWNYLTIPTLQRLHPWSLGMNITQHFIIDDIT